MATYETVTCHTHVYVRACECACLCMYACAHTHTCVNKEKEFLLTPYSHTLLYECAFALIFFMCDYFYVFMCASDVALC